MTFFTKPTPGQPWRTSNTQSYKASQMERNYRRGYSQAVAAIVNAVAAGASLDQLRELEGDVLGWRLALKCAEFVEPPQFSKGGAKC